MQKKNNLPQVPRSQKHRLYSAPSDSCQFPGYPTCHVSSHSATPGDHERAGLERGLATAMRACLPPAPPEGTREPRARWWWWATGGGGVRRAGGGRGRGALLRLPPDAPPSWRRQRRRGGPPTRRRRAGGRRYPSRPHPSRPLRPLTRKLIAPSMPSSWRQRCGSSYQLSTGAAVHRVDSAAPSESRGCPRSSRSRSLGPQPEP
jgi:hypothetical protein